MSLSTAIFRQLFKMYEENYPMVLWVSFGPFFPGHKYPSVDQFNFISWSK